MIETVGVREMVTDLYHRYAELLDEGPLEDWPELFTEDCSYRIIPRENHDRGLPLAVMRCDSRAMLRDRILAVTKLSVYAPRRFLRLITNIRVGDEQGGELSSRANYVVYQTGEDGRTELFNAGRHLDRLVRDGGALRFREKLCVFDTVMVPNSIVAPI